MGDADVLVNEGTGETMSLTEYIAQQREIERDIMRLDAAIETHKEALKAAKDGKEKAVRDLRATVREIKMRGLQGKRRRSKTRKTRVETSPR